MEKTVFSFLSDYVAAASEPLDLSGQQGYALLKKTPGLPETERQ